jgi:hypothetical protein
MYEIQALNNERILKLVQEVRNGVHDGLFTVNFEASTSLQSNADDVSRLWGLKSLTGASPIEF